MAHSSLTKAQRRLRRFLIVLALVTLSLPLWPWILHWTLESIVGDASQPPGFTTTVIENERPKFPDPGQTLPSENSSLPDWAILPEKLHGISSESFVQQLPYGSVTRATLAVQDQSKTHAASYAAKLVAAGYQVETTIVRLTYSGDGEWAIIAHDPKTGRAVFARMHSDEFGFRTFAELLFWDAPVPE